MRFHQVARVLEIVSAASMNYHASHFHRDSSRDKSLIGIAGRATLSMPQGVLLVFDVYLLFSACWSISRVDKTPSRVSELAATCNHAKTKIFCHDRTHGNFARRFLLHERASWTDPAKMVTKNYMDMKKKAILRMYHATGDKVNTIRWCIEA